MKTVPEFSKSFTKEAHFTLLFAAKYLNKVDFIIVERKFVNELLEVHFGWIYCIKILVNTVKVLCITCLMSKVLSIWSVFHLVSSSPADQGMVNPSDSWVEAGGLSSPTSLLEELKISVPQEQLFEKTPDGYAPFFTEGKRRWT